MAHTGGFIHLYHSNADSLPPRFKYPLLRGTPGGRVLAPGVKRRILRDGDHEIRSRTGFPHEMEPLGIKSLPWGLWIAPSLIGLEYCAQANEDLRRKGDR
jgi:hypothetical protein